MSNQGRGIEAEHVETQRYHSEAGSTFLSRRSFLPTVADGTYSPLSLFGRRPINQMEWATCLRLRDRLRQIPKVLSVAEKGCFYLAAIEGSRL